MNSAHQEHSEDMHDPIELLQEQLLKTHPHQRYLTAVVKSALAARLYIRCAGDIFWLCALTRTNIK